MTKVEFLKDVSYAIDRMRGKMTIIQVAYNPEFTQDFKKFIKNYVQVSMSSNDNSTNQYFIEFMKDAIDDMDFDIKIEDRELLNKLDQQKIEYIEI